MKPAAHERRHRSDEGQGIAERSMRERVPVDELDLRAGTTDELRAAAKKELLAMAGYTEEKAEAELSPVGSKAAAVEASPTKEELSEANAELLASPKRKAEYSARENVLKQTKQAKGIPTFYECIKAMEAKGNKVLDALRAKTQDLRLTIAVVVEEDGKVKSYRPGLIEAKAEPEFLRDEMNPKNYAGHHYDAVYADLTPLGLREPDYDEWQATFETVKAMDDVLIDRKGWTMLNIGERTDKSASVPLAIGAIGRPLMNWSTSDSQDAKLVSRPSVWGADVLPKTT